MLPDDRTLIQPTVRGEVLVLSRYLNVARRYAKRRRRSTRVLLSNY